MKKTKFTILNEIHDFGQLKYDIWMELVVFLRPVF